MSESKTIYQLIVKIHHQDAKLIRKEELYFEHESQALKVLDRFKELSESQMYGLSWNISKFPLYSNANDYHGV